MTTPRSAVVSFRSRNPIDIAERFAAELSDESIRTIDCDDCAFQYSAACDDCVVRFLLDGPLEAAASAKPVVALSAPEVDTLELLQSTGLAPQSHFAVRAIALVTQ